VSISSINDWQKLGVPNAKEDAGDWLRFERPSSLQRVVAQERELESRRLAAYTEYVELVESDQRRVPPKFKVSPLSYEDWSKYIPADVTDISLASQIATNAALLKITRTEEAALAEAESKQAREDVLAGKPDKEFVLPDEIKGLRMSVEEAKAYASEQSKLFVEHNPEYYPCPANVAAITKYLTEQTDVVIPNEECFRLAWVRLRGLGLIEERPVLAKEPEPVTQPSEPIPAEGELVDGYDLETGEPRKYTQHEIWNMDSSTYRKAFRAWGENRPKFTRGYYGQR
jgi:hypothetical protein